MMVIVRKKENNSISVFILAFQGNGIEVIIFRHEVWLEVSTIKVKLFCATTRKLRKSIIQRL